MRDLVDPVCYQVKNRCTIKNTRVRYCGNHTFTFEGSICHHRPVPGCSGAFWALPARRERNVSTCSWAETGDPPSGSNHCAQPQSTTFPLAAPSGHASQCTTQLHRKQHLYQYTQHVNTRPARWVAAVIWKMVLVRGNEHQLIPKGTSLCSAIKLYLVAQLRELLGEIYSLPSSPGYLHWILFQ